MEIKKLIRQVLKDLSNAEWAADDLLAKQLRLKLDMLQYKLSIGETMDWEH